VKEPSSSTRPIISSPRAAYVHIPFCVSKCWYCGFNSSAGQESIFDDYVRALIAEIQATIPPYKVGIEGGTPDYTQTPIPPYKVGIEGGTPALTSVYFGGGTPTTLTARRLADILAAIRRTFGFAPGCEITIEANPGTVDQPKLAALLDAGFNRLSLGVQSFDDDFLRSIGRAHTRDEALQAYCAARGAGFANVGIDLIFALPGQTVSHWSDTLDTAVGLRPEHISLYELSIEQGTRFAELRAEGRLAPADEDTRLRMYELAIGRLTEAGYEHYEVSNFARPGLCSRHNMTYWLNRRYYGFGAGATSYVNGTRAARVAHARDYIKAIISGSDPIEFSETLTPRARLGETIILGLRMLQGIDLMRVRIETGLDPLTEYADPIARLVGRGLVEIADTWLRVTHRGLLLLDDVAAEFV